MNRLPTVAVVCAVTFFCGCTTVKTTGPTASVQAVPAAQVANATTPELTARRALLYEMILGIQREVEMKAGLTMGLTIPDDRAKLNELYFEARQIDRELLRRWNSGDGGAQVETVKANL